MSADDSAIAAELPKVRTTTMSYHSDDVWYAEEFGFFRQAIGWNFLQKDRTPSQHKNDKICLPFFLCLQCQWEREGAAHDYWEVTKATTIR